MKKKMSLRGELALLMLLSLFLCFTAAIVIRNQGIGLHGRGEEERIREVNSECITRLKKNLINYGLQNTEKVQSFLQDRYGYLVGYEFYITRKDGTVLAGTSQEVQKVDASRIQDGKRIYSVSKNDPNVFRLSGCDYLKDQCYLYFVYLKYDENDTGMVAGALVGTLICFFLLSWGRISYISVIRSAVGVIAEGDLSARVPLHYKNELRRLAEDINHMALSLETEERKKNEFLTNISHDIRTPLTTILGYLKMIREGRYNSREEMDSYLEVMERKGAFLARMLEDFFQYSKIVSQDMELKSEPFELNEMLRQFYEEEEEEFREKGLKLELDLYEKPLECKGDTELLARVVGNLLGNALKYSVENSSVLLKSSMEKAGHVHNIVFLLQNVPKEELSEEELGLLFKRLYKQDRARSGEGSGLGLAIVDNIVKLHGGKAEAYKKGKELVFRVTLKS